MHPRSLPLIKRARPPIDAVPAAESVALTHPERVVFPAVGVTKGDLFAYAREVAPLLVPELRGRPLSLERYPRGAAGPRFFEQEAPRGTPPWVRVEAIPTRTGKSVRHVICDNTATLAWLTNMNVLTVHAWMSTMENLDRPDAMVFDLDTGDDTTLATLARVAIRLRDRLDAAGFAVKVKTSGGSGLHVVAPLEPDLEFTDVRNFAEAIARAEAQAAPSEATVDRSLATRPRGAVYLDYLQIGRGKTLVPPYVVRAGPSAPVSTPLAWSEVERWAGATRKKSGHAGGAIAAFDLSSARRRLDDLGDLWGSVVAPKPRKRPARRAAPKRVTASKEGS